MCVWRRVDQLERTIALLETQSSKNIEFHIWNNNPRVRHTVDGIVSNTSELQVRVTHSAKNAGGFGRFYLARDLAERHPYVIFVDDDETFAPTTLTTLVEEFQSRSVSSFWAWRFTTRNNYWKRVPAAPGERADYCATGGMITDASVFSDPSFFRCPKRFWFVEDLWLSFYADHVLGWSLRKSKAYFQLHDDGRDQFTALARNKSAFLRYLVRAGWDVPKAFPSLTHQHADGSDS